MPDLKKMLTLEALSEALPSWLKRSTKPEYNADEIDSTLTTNQFVTASDKDNWNAKGTYSKPSGGIPKSDLSSIVQASLEKADSALQSETDPTVPSWAKQTNKPSYTQDEVADGSTYKRVTQTEKNTWNGKQNALTTTQMQAVNSGITSAGVAQISTNQSNILLLESMNGKKNKINFTLDWYKRSDLYNSEGTWSGNVYTVSNVGTVTVNPDGTLTAKKTSSGTRLLFRIVPMSEGLDYVGDWMFGCPEGGGDNKYKMACEQAQSPWGNRGIDSGSGSVIGSSTLPIYIYIMLDSSYTTPTEGIIFKPMIISAEAKNAGFTEYMPYTLPNTAITPELIELCDSGAKNLLNTPTVTVSNITWAVDSNSYITASPNNSDPRYYEYSNRQYTVHLKPGSYVFVLDIKTSTSNNYANLVLLSTSDTVVATITNAEIKGKTGMVYSEFTITTEGDYGLIAKVYDLVSRIMICTKSAYGVSTAFVPYRYDPYTTAWQNISNSTTLYARRVGRVVTINGYMDNISFTANTAVTIGTINSSIGIPPNQVRAVCNVGSNAYSVGKQGYVTISSTDGQIKVTSEYSGTGAVYFSLSYII